MILVTVSTDAIEPANTKLRVTMKLMMKVSTLPRIRQLTAFTKEREWVSGARNNMASPSDFAGTP